MTHLSEIDRTIVRDPGRQGYRVSGGRLLPSVTQILASAKLTGLHAVPDHVLEGPRRRGQDVHELTADFDTMGGAYPCEHDGYVASWRAYREKWNQHPILVEAAVADTRRGYAGTIDRLMISGWPGNDLTLIDIKTTASLGSAVAIQLAAYAAALRQTYELHCWPKRAAVRLKADGSLPQVREYPARSLLTDLGVFLRALEDYYRA